MTLLISIPIRRLPRPIRRPKGCVLCGLAQRSQRTGGLGDLMCQPTAEQIGAMICMVTLIPERRVKQRLVVPALKFPSPERGKILAWFGRDSYGLV